MNDYWNERIGQLSTGTVLRTLRGARCRVANLSVADVWMLLAYYRCELAHLHRHLWAVNRLYEELRWATAPEKGVSQNGNEEPRNRPGRGRGDSAA